MHTKIINCLVILGFLFLFLRIFNLQIIQHEKFKELSKKNCIRLIPQVGSRGRILDRKNNIIVDSYLYYDVMVLPQETNQVDKLLMNVSEVLGINFRDLKGAFISDYINPFMPVTIAKNIDIKKAIALEELKFDNPGLLIQPHPQRFYPYGRLASHIIGYLNEIDRWRLTKLQDYGYKTKDIVGFGGVEEKYDYYLRAEEGGMTVEVDRKTRPIRVLGFKPPRNGKDIQLTLDLKIQKIVEEKLMEHAGCVIIMNPYNGEILALASYPNFNPSIFISKVSSSIRNLFNNPHAPLINRAISAAYPPGSVFKLVASTAALELGKINLSTTFFCPGSMHIGNQEFSCWNTHNQQNLMEGIINSCNVFFYKTGLALGAQTIHDYALKFGFGKTTLVDLPYEVSGFVPSPLWRRIYRFQNWFDGDTANLAIGQGDLLITPMQLARMMAVFANRGNLVTPYIVKAIDGQDISGSKQKIITLPLKESSLSYIRESLRQVISHPNGTANILSGLGVSVAGKTGTAQVSRGQSHGWFTGFFPFKNPKFVICVFLEHGGSGLAACILTKQIIEMMIQEGLV